MEKHYYFILLKFYYSKIKVPENKKVRQLVQGIVLSNAHKKNLDQLTLFENSRHFAHQKILNIKRSIKFYKSNKCSLLLFLLNLHTNCHMTVGRKKCLDSKKRKI